MLSRLQSFIFYTNLGTRHQALAAAALDSCSRPANPSLTNTGRHVKPAQTRSPERRSTGARACRASCWATAGWTQLRRGMRIRGEDGVARSRAGSSAARRSTAISTTPAAWPPMTASTIHTLKDMTNSMQM